jgi:hypothetical protein
VLCGGFAVARTLLWLARGYLGLAVAALVLGVISTWGWFGTEATPMGMVFAVMLAFPWPGLIGDIANLGVPFAMLLLTLALMVNALVLFAVARFAARRR